MKTSEVLRLRLANQKLSAPHFKQPAEVVRWLGAVQAQDFNAAKWALGLRMSEATNAVVEAAFNKGEILRTHLLRPTWHFVTPQDIRWLLELTAPRVNLKCAPNYRKYELDDATFKRANKALTKALQGGKHLTRATLKTVLNKSGVVVDDPVRLVHVLLRAELDGVVCSGPRSGKQFTYALLEERVTPTKPLTRDEALAKLTQRYFNSHGPATVPDFVWWSGLTAADAKRGIDLADLREDIVAGKTYWTGRSATTSPSEHSAHLLPAFDEYNVAYKDRELVLDGNKDISTWDLLGPIIIVNGKIAGTWKGTTLNILNGANKADKTAIAKAAERYTKFLGAD